MQRRWYPTVWMFFSCVAMGAIPGLIQVVFTRMSRRQFLEAAFEGSIYSLCIGMPCWLLIPRASISFSERPLPQTVLRGAALFSLFCVAGCFLANLILLALGRVSAGSFGAVFWWSLRICLMITFTFGVAAFTINTLQTRLAATREELHRQQIAEERQSKIAAEARFASLESRVHPHFLFNTLNSISALVRENPAEAELMIERLSALLRYSLDSELAGVVALREELRIVREYLAIEQVRFGARLRFRIDAEEEALSRTVPALSVQTLVENSVKYAVSAARAGAEIRVSARLEDGALRVEVSDDGPGFEPALSLKPGHGLDLLKRRLESLFGAGASLEMGAVDGRTSVSIQVAA